MVNGRDWSSDSTVAPYPPSLEREKFDRFSGEPELGRLIECDGRTTRSTRMWSDVFADTLTRRCRRESLSDRRVRLLQPITAQPAGRDNGAG
jgi:hypothetical protein